MEEHPKMEWLDEMFMDESAGEEQQPYKRRKNAKRDRMPKAKKCKCPKSKCLKLYCICFASGKYCDGCQCTGCENDQNHQAERTEAINWILEKRPDAFNPKVGASLSTTSAGKLVEGGEKAHLKGCSCKSCNCRQNYCECYSAGVLCSRLCKCVSCKNDEVVDSSGFGESVFRAMPLASRAEDVRPTNNYSDEGSDVLEVSKEAIVDIRKQPWFYVTDQFISKTAQSLCNMAMQEGWRGPVEVQKKLLCEFGSSLDEIIDRAKSYKPSSNAMVTDEFAADFSETPPPPVEQVPLVFRRSDILSESYSVQACEPVSANHPFSGTTFSSKACSCKSCNCVRKYCECFNAGVICSERCKCSSCKNSANPDSDGLLDALKSVHTESMSQMAVTITSDKTPPNQTNSTLPTGMFLRNRDHIKLKSARRLKDFL